MAANEKTSKKKAARKKSARRRVADSSPKKPDPFQPGRWHVNQKDAADFCGVAIQVFQRRGIEPDGKCGRSTYYDLRKVSRWEKDRERRQGFDEGQRARPAELDTIAEDAALAELDWTRERAEGQRLKNAAMRRELAPVRMVTWAISQAGGRIAAALGTLKGKIKRAQPDLGNEALHAIEQIVVECQNTAAEIKLDWDEFDESDLADPRVH
jgi:phage terminase Nu1 subunit (DNA packaging protein)